MSARRFALTLAIAALIQPPVAAHARVLIVPACGGALHRLIVPDDPADPGQEKDCAKACHAVTDRRGKSAKARPGCC